MEKVDSKIIRFIKKHHVLTLSTAIDGNAYCANCFYSYLEDENILIFTSDLKTKHIQDILENNYVAGSIVLETRIIGKIQGLQFNGFMVDVDEKLAEKVRKSYIKKFPFAMLMETQLWALELSFLKFTDNTLGFGKKIVWEKE
jgi:uncharacterized protein YhbP (UPF0306 family)